MNTLFDKLTQAWRRQQRFYHLRGAARLVPWVVGLFLLTLLADWLLDLPGALRLALLLANLGGLAWLSYRHWVQHLRRFDATNVSLQVEKLHPGLNNLLVSYVQLNLEAPAAPHPKVHGSPAMIQAMRGQAEKAVSPLDFGGIVNFQSLRNLLIASGVVLVFFVASAVVAGEYYAVLLGRLLNPFSALAYPTRTKIEEVRGPVAVKQGDKIELEALVGGEVPDDGYLFVRMANASWEPFLLTRGELPVFRFRLPKAVQSFAYYFRIGDARSERREVKVVSPPRIVTAKVNLTYPQYTGRAADEFVRLQLAPMPEGTAVAWELRCDQPLAKARMIFGGERPQTLDLTPDDADPRVVRLSVKDVGMLAFTAHDQRAVASLSYHFEWTEKEHSFKFTEATRHVLEVVPDRPPVVVLHKPAPGAADSKILATTRKNLHLLFEVNDDYGLGKARIAYRVNGGPEQYVGLGSFPKDSKSDNFQTQWILKDSWKGIKEGDVLTCSVEATDNRSTKAGPNLGRSPAFRVHIVDDKEFQAYIERQIAQGLERTTGAAQEVLTSSKKVKALIPEKAP